jgi:hypothetical protein
MLSKCQYRTIGPKCRFVHVLAFWRPKPRNQMHRKWPCSWHQNFTRAKARSVHSPTGNNRSKSYLVNMILISLNTSNFSSNVRISRELSIMSDENYVVSSMVTTTVVLLEIWTLVFSEISTRAEWIKTWCIVKHLDLNYYQLLDWAVVFNYISYPHKHVNLILPGWCTFDNLLQMWDIYCIVHKYAIFVDARPEIIDQNYIY